MYCVVTSSLPPNNCQHTSLSGKKSPDSVHFRSALPWLAERDYDGASLQGRVISQSDYNLSDRVMLYASAHVHEQLCCNPVCTAG